MIDEKLMEAANAFAGQAEEAPALGETEDEQPSRRRKGLVPVLEPGDATMLRLLASWRFASPVALAAIAWPLRSSAGQEWRMRRFVDCGWLGRRRLRFATTRHVVWARTPSTRLVLTPAPASRSPPRWSEAVARHGWTRSMLAAAYVKAGWQVDAAGVDGPALQALQKLNNFVAAPFIERVFPTPTTPYPFDLALGRRKSDGRSLLHILVVDDQQAALDRTLAALPLEGPPLRSSRIAVRFFPTDDTCIWSNVERRCVFESPRFAAVRTNLQAANIWDIAPGNEGPDAPPWLTADAVTK